MPNPNTPSESRKEETVKTAEETYYIKRSIFNDGLPKKAGDYICFVTTGKIEENHYNASENSARFMLNRYSHYLEEIPLQQSSGVVVPTQREIHEHITEEITGSIVESQRSMDYFNGANWVISEVKRLNKK